MKKAIALSVTAALMSFAAHAEPIHCLTRAENGFVRNGIPGYLTVTKNPDTTIDLVTSIDGIKYQRTYQPDDDLRFIPAYDASGSHSVSLSYAPQSRHDETSANIITVDALTATTETVYRCESDDDISKDEADAKAWAYLTPDQRKSHYAAIEAKRAAAAKAKEDKARAEFNANLEKQAAEARRQSDIEQDRYRAEDDAWNKTTEGKTYNEWAAPIKAMNVMAVDSMRNKEGVDNIPQRQIDHDAVMMEIDQARKMADQWRQSHPGQPSHPEYK